jgi:hypothetical protein
MSNEITADQFEELNETIKKAKEEFESSKNSITHEEKKIKESIIDKIFSERSLGIIIFLYIIIRVGGDFGKIIGLISNYAMIPINFIVSSALNINIEFPDWFSAILAGAILITLVTIIINPRNKQSFLKKLWILVTVFILLTGFYLSFQEETQAEQIGEVATEAGKEASENTVGFFMQIYCQSWGITRGDEECIKKENKEEVTNVNQYNLQFKIEPISQQIKKIYTDRENSLSFKITISSPKETPVQLLSYKCIFDGEKEAFYQAELDQTISKKKTISLSCENLEKLFQDTAYVSQTKSVNIYITYKINSEIIQNIPIINCNSQKVLQYLQRENTICNDLTLDELYKKIDPNELRVDTQPYGNNPIKTTISNLKFELPLKIGDDISNSFFFNLITQDTSNIGKIISTTLTNYNIPDSLILKNKEELENQKIKEEYEKEINLEIKVEENDQKQIESYKTIEQQSLIFSMETLLEKKLTTPGIVFKDVNSIENAA